MAREKLITIYAYILLGFDITEVNSARGTTVIVQLDDDRS